MTQALGEPKSERSGEHVKRGSDAKGLDFKEIRKRKRERIAIVLLFVVLIALTFAEFRLTKVSHTLPFVNSIFFFGILNLNIVLLIALFWLIFRNIGKVFFERRSRVLGSSLKMKLVVAFLSFSIIPTIVLFIISSLYINSSFDKWFSLRIQNTLQASLEITRTYYRNADRTAMHFADHLSLQLGKRMESVSPSTEIGEPLGQEIQKFLDEQRDLLALDAVEFYSDPFDERVISQGGATRKLPSFYPRLALDLLDRAFAGERVSVIQHLDSGDMIRCIVPVYSTRRDGMRRENPEGVVAVSAYIPVSLVSKVGEIASVFDDYRDTNPLQYPIKTTYFAILVLITLVILFVAVWIGLFIARQLTVPVERLVRGAQAVGAGDLDVAIDKTGHDEIAGLIDSFNSMIADLRGNREKLTEASQDLEKRRLQLETVLANVGTGVIVVERPGVVSTLNRAASQLLGVDPKDAIGRGYREIFNVDGAPLVEVINRAFESSAKTPEAGGEVTQWTMHNGDGSAKSLAAIATPLHDNEVKWGVVAVIDDLTYLMKAQREVAWREVARRIAHEIKNPLTPIKLSAQRLQRRFGHLVGKDRALLLECTETIVRHTDELKEMVNEFSSFARFPEISPAPNDLNQVIREVESLYSQAHPDIEISLGLEPRLPVFEFDRDQVKRVFINLMDNAIAALGEIPVGKRKIWIETHFNENLQIAATSIRDNGVGMDEATRSRMFEPYFSTKKEGTGLGLAIAKRIVNDHDGFIRVQSAPGEGTLFSIELPTSLRPGKDLHAQNDSRH